MTVTHNHAIKPYGGQLWQGSLPSPARTRWHAKDHAIVDAIVGSRGALQGPFSMFLHCPELAGRARISGPLCASRARSICGCGCSPR